MKIMELVDAYAFQANNHSLYGGAHWHKEKMVAREVVLKALEQLNTENTTNTGTIKELETELAEEKAKVVSITIAMIEFLEAPEIAKIVPGIYARTLRKTL